MNVFKTLRLENNYSQVQLADLLSVHQTAVSQWELGKSFPDIDTLKKIATLYGVTTDYLLGRDETQQHINDDEALEYLDELHKRPEMKILFDAGRKATKKDIEASVAVIEALKKQSEGDTD